MFVSMVLAFGFSWSWSVVFNVLNDFNLVRFDVKLSIFNANKAVFSVARVCRQEALFVRHYHALHCHVSRVFSAL